MKEKQVYESLSEAIVNGELENIRQKAKQALDLHIDPLKAVEKGLSEGMKIVGNRFESGKAFLPELLIAADAFNAAMEIFKPTMESQGKRISKSGKVLIGTSKGDLHNIGKNIVSKVLEINGFEVVDIGVDKQTLSFIEEAEKFKADVIAISSLMTTSMPRQKEVIDILREMGIRDKYYIIVGGGPVSSEWAEEIGADGYGETAFQAVEVINKGFLGII